ncbi:MAG: GTP-binding protein [Verrucomicrobiia bacterium]
MIPLALVTGFLGSGKTTFLKQFVRRYRGRKIVYLVNEFSAKDVDGALLAGETPDVVSVAGGSIFCRCLVTEFIAHLRELPARFGTSATPVEAVVVEASGIANPAVAGQMLREARLDRQYELTSVVAIVDPGSFGKLLRTLPNIRAQIEAASHILINKTDAYPATLIGQTEAAVCEINPAVTPVRTSHGAADVELFGTRFAGVQGGELAQCSDPNFASFTVLLDRGLDLDRFRAALEAVKEDIYRIKGFVATAGQRFHLDYSASGLRVEETAEQRPSELVFILRAPLTAATRRFLHSVRTGC